MLPEIRGYVALDATNPSKGLKYKKAHWKSWAPSDMQSKDTCSFTNDIKQISIGESEAQVAAWAEYYNQTHKNAKKFVIKQIKICMQEDFNE